MILLCYYALLIISYHYIALLNSAYLTPQSLFAVQLALSFQHVQHEWIDQRGDGKQKERVAHHNRGLQCIYISRTSMLLCGVEIMVGWSRVSRSDAALTKMNSDV